MSLPLSRRIVRAALLVGAAAAPLVGAGTASAAALPQASELGGLTNVDSAGVTTVVDGAAQKAGTAATDKVTKAAVPTLHKGVGTVGSTALPAAQQSLGKTAGATTGLVGQAAEQATAGKAGPVADTLPVGDVHLPSTDGLPVRSLPLGY
jgi:hypothetical protein